MPRVSIVLPCHNGAAYLREALDSIVNQTYRDFELIVVDSSSTDGSGEMVESYGDDRFRLATLPLKCGVAMARNLGIRMATGEWIATMDADDIMHPERLATQAEFMADNAAVDILGSHFTLFSGDKRSPRIQPLGDAEIKAKLLFVNGNALHNPTTMMRRALLEKYHLYYPPLEVDSDHGLWVRAMGFGATFANLDRDLLAYRRHPHNLSRSNPELTEITKLQLRRELLGLFFSDLTAGECNAIARAMGNLARLSLDDCFHGVHGIDKLLRIGRCNHGASLPDIRRIASHVRGQCLARIRGILGPVQQV